MPIYAGYVMTRKDQLAWLRREHPEIEADEQNIPILRPLTDRIRKLGLLKIFKVVPVIVPQDHDAPERPIGHDPLENMGYMFVRRIRHSGGPVWLPPRNVRGVVNDNNAGRVLKKYIIDIGDWVVIYEPSADVASSRYVYCPDPSVH